MNIKQDYTSQDFIENINKLNDDICIFSNQIKRGINCESYKNIIAQLRHDTFSLIFYGFDCCTISYFQYEKLIDEYVEVFKLLFNMMFKADLNINIDVKLMFLREYIDDIFG